MIYSIGFIVELVLNENIWNLFIRVSIVILRFVYVEVEKFKIY